MQAKPLCHIVLYAFKSKSQLSAAVSTIQQLKEKCLKNGKPYVLDVHVGTTQPHEPIRTLGFNLASIMYFKNDQDRQYFVKDDPVHLELKSFTTPRIAKDLLVLDFISGQAEPSHSSAEC